MILEEYNEELHIKSEKELSYLEGKAVGEAEGSAAGEAAGRAEGMSGEIRIIRRKLSSGVPAGELAELLEMENGYVCRIEELLRSFPEETDVQIAARYLEETAAD